MEPEYWEASQKQVTVGTNYYWASKRSINIRITIEQHYQHHNSIIFDLYNFDLSNEMFLIIRCLSSIFTNILGIYFTKCISLQKFDKFRANVQYVTTKNSTHIVPQPPYSPVWLQMAPCDFWLFLKLKKPLRGHRFDTIEEIQSESKKALMAILEIEFNKCSEDWKKIWHKCIISQGDEID